MDKFKSFFNLNKNIIVFLIGIMIVGVIFGSSLPFFLSSDDKKLVSEYLIGFIDGIKSGSDSLFLFINGLLNNGIFLLLIWILGISIIGVPIVMFLFFAKCFIFGFSISSIIINYGFKGILFSFAYIFPHQAINICIYCFLTSFSLFFSIKLFFFFFKKKDFNLKASFNKYLKVLFISLLLFVFSLLYEAFVNPYVLGFIFNLLGL